MTSRREFLKVGLAASALPLATRARDVSAAVPTVPLYKVLYDTRFPASVAFARRAAARGLAVHAMSGDMTSFWYDDLYHRWQRGAAAIAGLTAHGALFCLERLAWDQRMRVVYRGEHSAAATDGEWGAALADVVAACPEGRLQPPSTLALTSGTLLASDKFFSWVIAPVARA